MNYNHHRKKQLIEAINNLPRVRLAALPTPLEKLSNLQKRLGGPEIYIKRDDLTGVGLGGNKTRMFEFSLAKVKKLGKNCVIGTAAVQSNYCRQLSAAGAKLGLDVYLVLRKVRGQNDEEIQGNLFLNYLFGAKVILVETNDWNVQNEVVYDLKEKLSKVGRKPYIMRSTNDNDMWLDAVSYINCGIELFEQLEEQAINPDYIFLTSTDTTQIGLLIAARFLEVNIPIIGISPLSQKFFPSYSPPDSLLKLGREVIKNLNIELDLNRNDIISLQDYVGDGYGFMNEDVREAIKLMAETEGIVLDPVYTGKGFLGLVDFIKKGKLKKEDRVIYLHTGGYPAIFAYADEFKFGR